MNKTELLKRIDAFNKRYEDRYRSTHNHYYAGMNDAGLGIRNMVECLDEIETKEDSIVLKDVINRLNELPKYDRLVWLKKINIEFGNKTDTSQQERLRAHNLKRKEMQRKNKLPNKTLNLWEELGKLHGMGADEAKATFDTGNKVANINYLEVSMFIENYLGQKVVTNGTRNS